MTITLYENKSEKNKVHKEITEKSVKVGRLRENTSIVTPMFTIEGVFSELSQANYIYVAEFRRYYYITDMVQIAGNLTQISCRVDVLMSFKDEILANTAVIARQEAKFNRYLNDANFKTYQNNIVVTKKLSGAGFGEAGFILVTAGQAN